MKLLTTIAISLAASAASAAAVTRYAASHAAAGAFWQHDAVAALWLYAGGPVPLAVAVFAVASFVCVTIGAAVDLGRVRVRIERGMPGGDGAAPSRSAIFAGTAFAHLDGVCAGDSAGPAPMSLLRGLRREIWRVYVKHLAAVEILALAAGAGLLVARPAWFSPPAAADGGAGTVAACLLVLAAIAAVWLLLDEWITRLGVAIADAFGTSGADGALAPRPGREEELLGAVDQLVRALATRPDPALRIAEELSLVRAELQPLCERLDRSLTPADAAQMILAPRDPPLPAEAVANLTQALSEVAHAMHHLSAETGAGRWGELEAAVQAMSATLDDIADAVRAEARPRTVTDELEDLLDEISDPAPAAPRRPRRIASR